MGQYRIKVAETRSYEVEYLVEADDAAEAREKAEIGDTVEESDARHVGVLERTATSEPVLIETAEGAEA